MANLATAIAAMIQAATPVPSARLGTVATVRLPATDRDGTALQGKVTVSGIAETPMPCDWSAGFDLELSALNQALVGRQVEVHFIDGQPIIAYSLVQGAKT